MTGSTGPTGAARPPASIPRIIPPGLRRLAAAVWLAAVLASTAGAASASTSVVPYSITEIGPAPATGFKVSDIGAVPVPSYHSPDTTDPMADESEGGEIDPR